VKIALRAGNGGPKIKLLGNRLHSATPEDARRDTIVESNTMVRKENVRW
jgi:hypothetical protein